MLYQKNIKLRRSIREWNNNKVGNLTAQKQVCKTVLLRLDKISEQRQLTPLEVLSPKLIKDRLQTIVALEEEMWHQRAKKA
jgi:hypothetical protein